MPYISNETCPKCGAEYEVTGYDLPTRDVDYYDCACGHRMKEWDGSWMASYKLIKPGRPTDA